VGGVAASCAMMYLHKPAIKSLDLIHALPLWAVITAIPPIASHILNKRMGKLENDMEALAAVGVVLTAATGLMGRVGILAVGCVGVWARHHDF